MQEQFAIIDTKLYVPVMTLLTQDNAKLLQQLKLGFKRIVDWSKYHYQSKVSIERENQYLDYLTDLSFQGLFILLFENNDNRTAHTEYFLQNVKIKDSNVVIDGQKLLMDIQ